MPFIANHFHRIKAIATNNGEHPSTITPISSTCCIIEAGKKGKAKKPRVEHLIHVTSSREAGKKNLDLTESDKVYTRRECEAGLEWIALNKEEDKRNQELIKKKQKEELKVKYPVLKPNPFPDCMLYDVYDSSDDDDLYDSRILNNCPEDNCDDPSSICLNTPCGYIGNDKPNTEPCMPSISV
jgi:hypothetical protein